MGCDSVRCEGCSCDCDCVCSCDLNRVRAFFVFKRLCSSSSALLSTPSKTSRASSLVKDG